MTVDHLGGLLMRNVNDTGALFGQNRASDSGSASGWTTFGRLQLLGRPEGGAGRRVPGATHPRREPRKFRALVYQAIDTTN